MLRSQPPAREAPPPAPTRAPGADCPLPLHPTAGRPVPPPRRTPASAEVAPHRLRSDRWPSGRDVSRSRVAPGYYWRMERSGETNAHGGDHMSGECRSTRRLMALGAVLMVAAWSHTTGVEGRSPEDRLKALGIELPPAPKPLASYVPAVRTGNLVYLAGQGPVAGGKPTVTGK